MSPINNHSADKRPVANEQNAERQNAGQEQAVPAPANLNNHGAHQTADSSSVPDDAAPLAASLNSNSAQQTASAPCAPATSATTAAHPNNDGSTQPRVVDPSTLDPNMRCHLGGGLRGWPVKDSFPPRADGLVELDIPTSDGIPVFIRFNITRAAIERFQAAQMASIKAEPVLAKATH